MNEKNNKRQTKTDKQDEYANNLTAQSSFQFLFEFSFVKKKRKKKSSFILFGDLYTDN